MFEKSFVRYVQIAQLAKRLVQLEESPVLGRYKTLVLQSSDVGSLVSPSAQADLHCQGYIPIVRTEVLHAKRQAATSIDDS